jgi:hypothetical protein
MLSRAQPDGQRKGSLAGHANGNATPNYLGELLRDASKAHSAVEAWARILQDRLNEALAFASQWLGVSDTATVVVNTDFHGDASGVDEAKVLADAQKRQVISKKAEIQELKRGNILGPDYDEDADEVQSPRKAKG